MRNASTYRGARRADARAAQRITGNFVMERREAPVGPGRRNKWLMRHRKLAPFYAMAVNMLGNGARWRAIRKMMVVLAQAPKIRPVGSEHAYPYVAMLGRHERGSWRSFPRVVIDANLQVQP